MHGKTAQFADDTKFYCEVLRANDCEKIPKDLACVYEWSLKRRLRFNVEKCKVLTLCRSQTPIVIDYKLNGTKIDRVNSIKDIVVVIDFNITWNIHIRGVVTGTNRMLDLIKRTAGYNASVSVEDNGISHL